MNALRMNATQEGIAIFPESSNNSTKTLSFSKRTKSVKYYSASRVKKFSYVLLKHAQWSKCLLGMCGPEQIW